MTIKVLVDETGLNAKKFNPFNKMRSEWREFEQAVKYLPLTKQCEPGSVINAELVWQYEHLMSGWFTTDDIEMMQGVSKNKRKAYDVKEILSTSINLEKLEKEKSADEKALEAIKTGIFSTGTPQQQFGFMIGSEYRKQQSKNDIITLIEEMAKEYAAEIDLDLLTKKGIYTNEIRIDLLKRILTTIKQ